MIYETRSFSGGINAIDVDTEIDDNQYQLAINSRNRFGDVVPIQKHVVQTGLPAGNYQGGTSVGNVAIVFVNGKAYYQVHGGTVWFRIANFQMDSIVDLLYTQAIPKSTANFIRKSGDSANASITLSTNFNIGGNPAAILVQDGFNQPWLIQFDAVTQTFVARVTKNYTQWSSATLTATDREYVPIGKQMFMLNQKLFIVAADGKSIYQSVTGRPLDFMLNVDPNGNKLSSELRGGAQTTSFSFDSEVITCVRALNYPDAFLYATEKQVRIIQLDYTFTIFGEPLPQQMQVLDFGIINQQSCAESLGDIIGIDNDGIKSFNAVASVENEGRNSVFSKNISKWLSESPHDVGAMIRFDNYLMCYIRTKLGLAVVVYDEVRQQWCAADITEATNIRQFFTVEEGSVSKCYAVTNNAVYLMFTGETSESAQVWLKAISPEDTKREHRGQFVQPVFRGATEDGNVTITEYADEKYSARETRNINESVMAMAWPLYFPIGFNDKANMINNAFVFNKGILGKKLAYVIMWNTDAALKSVRIETMEVEKDAAIRQTATY
jgi:hypothetical protein